MGTKAKIFSSSYLDNVTFSGENYRKGDKQERSVTRILAYPPSCPLNSDMPRYSDLDKSETSGENGLYLSHVNIILGLYQRLSRNIHYLVMNRKISQYLAETTLQDAQKHVRSFPNQPYKWPADQAVTLYSLYLFDRNNQTNLSAQPIHEWLEYMRSERTEPETHLHYSEATKSIDYWKYPHKHS